jgi:hypothetical protein
MLNIFRKVRHRLLNESLPAWLTSKLSKYILYAIGEIILVVFGILIALSINNSNENQKNNEKEKVYLESLYQELKNDSLSFERANNTLNTLESASRLVIGYIENPPTLGEDSLNFLNQVRRMIATDQKLPEPIVWRELQSTGNLRLIHNRDLIERLYAHYSRVESVQSDYEVNAHPFIIQGRYFDSKTFSLKDQDDYFDNWKKDEISSKEVFKALLEDPEFYVIAKGVATGMIISKLGLSSVIKSGNETLQMVAKELELR